MYQLISRILHAIAKNIQKENIENRLLKKLLCNLQTSKNYFQLLLIYSRLILIYRYKKALLYSY